MKQANKPKRAHLIPSEVKVGKRKYKVERVEVIAGCRGDVTYETNTIRVASRSSYYAYTNEEQYNTFWHELTHAILHDMNSHLESNERFVKAFADRLTNAITSAKFTDPKA
jgi:hypothetical protein